MKAYPFSNGLPLASDPYFSRSYDNLDTTDIKNYYIIGFKPGFPLQASELNEIQEQFYIQQTLTTACINQWWGKGDFGPFWAGATPLLPPTTAKVTGSSNSIKNITFSNKWFFLNLPVTYTESLNSSTNLLISSWFFYDSDIVFQNFNLSLTSAGPMGLYIKSEKITYSEDDTLSDNSGGGSRTGFGFINQGADRFKLTLTGYGNGTDIDSSSKFYPIFYKTQDSSKYYLKTSNGYTFWEGSIV